MLTAVTVGILAVLWPAVALAQSTAEARAVLTGFVLADSSEAPLADAEVSIASIGLVTRSGADGTYRLGEIPPGTYIVGVRTIGFEPIATRLRFAASDSLERDFLLVRAAVAIAPVDVKAKADSFMSPKMRVFESRMRTGRGHFLTEAVLDSMKSRRIGDILMSRMPGAKVVSRGSAAWVAARRGPQSLRRTQVILPGDRARGADPGMCYAAIYLDGTLVYGGNPGESLFDVNSLATTEIAGIEYYSGPAQVPTEINATMNTCGVMVIWTK